MTALICVRACVGLRGVYSAPSGVMPHAKSFDLIREIYCTTTFWSTLSWSQPFLNNPQSGEKRKRKKKKRAKKDEGECSGSDSDDDGDGKKARKKAKKAKAEEEKEKREDVMEGVMDVAAKDKVRY